METQRGGKEARVFVPLKQKWRIGIPKYKDVFVQSVERREYIFYILFVIAN